MDITLMTNNKTRRQHMKRLFVLLLAVVIGLAFAGATFAADKAAVPAKDEKAAVATDKAPANDKTADTKTKVEKKHVKKHKKAKKEKKAEEAPKTEAEPAK